MRREKEEREKGGEREEGRKRGKREGEEGRKGGRERGGERGRSQVSVPLCDLVSSGFHRPAMCSL